VIRVIYQAGALIQKNSFCFLEGDAMLYQVGSGLAPIPGKLDIAHSIILAITAIQPFRGSVRFEKAGLAQRTPALHLTDTVTPGCVR
jgi:hypothetical protein